MTVVRVKGFQIFSDRGGKLRCYHRKSRTAIDLDKLPLGSPEFLAECGRITAKQGAKQKLKSGTLGQLVTDYRASEQFVNLAPRTQKDYLGKLDYLQPLATMPLISIDAPFVVNVRDKAAKKHGRRFGNYVKAVMSIVMGWGVERGRLPFNPVSKIRDVRRKKGAPRANRPWSDAERFAVLDAAPHHLKVPIALGMYLGLREGDVLRLEKSAIKDGVARIVTAKAGVLVVLPVLSPLAEILAAAPKHKVSTVAATSRGEVWTESGFRASWRKLRIALEKDEMVDPGLTFHGLRHTVATILRNAGIEPRKIADVLGQQTEGMALHYSRSADLSKIMAEVSAVFERQEAETRARFVKQGPEKVSNDAKNEAAETDNYLAK